jgi:hypothetical protein
MAPFGQAAASTARSEARPKAARSPGFRFRLRPSHCGRQLRWVRRAPDGALCTPLPVHAPSPHPFASCQIRGRRQQPHPPVPLRRQLRRPRPEYPVIEQCPRLGGASHRGGKLPRRTGLDRRINRAAASANFDDSYHIDPSLSMLIEQYFITPKCISSAPSAAIRMADAASWLTRRPLPALLERPLLQRLLPADDVPQAQTGG